MKKILLITLVALAILVSACAPFGFGTAATSTPIATLVQPAYPLETPTTEIFPTLTPAETATEIGTLLTGSEAETITPVAVDNYTSSLITDISITWGMTFASCTGTTPISFNGTITANNETDIQYKWLLSGPTSYATAPRKTNISTAGAITVHSGTYKLKCGNYTIGLQIIYPNPVTEKRHFSIP